MAKQTFDKIKSLWSQLGMSELIALRDELDKEIGWAEEEAEYLIN